MGFDLSVSDLLRTEHLPPSMVRPSGLSPSPPAAGGVIPLTYPNPYGSYDVPLAWGVTGQGWNEGSWIVREWLRLLLMGSFDLRLGTGVATYTRPSTTTMTDDTGQVLDVAANQPPFDWLVGPSGTSRLALRVNHADVTFQVPTSRNVRRREGAVSFWWKCAAVGAWGAQVFWECGSWRLQKNGNDLEFRVPLQDGTTLTVTSTKAWVVDQWYWIGASWKRGGNAQVWRDSDAPASAAISQRLAELGDVSSIGNGLAVNTAPNGYVVDFRVWPTEITTTLRDVLVALKA